MRGRAAVLLAACWLAACEGSGGENPDPEGETRTVGSSGTTLGGNSAEAEGMPVQPITRPEQTIAAGTISQVNNSGVEGSVTFRGIGEQTEVLYNVRGFAEATGLVNAAIVRGSCEAPGAAVAQLDPVAIGTAGIAAATDTVPLPPGEVLDGLHALVVKGENAGPATPPLACAPLPEWQRLPPTG